MKLHTSNIAMHRGNKIICRSHIIRWLDKTAKILLMSPRLVLPNRISIIIMRIVESHQTYKGKYINYYVTSLWWQKQILNVMNFVNDPSISWKFQFDGSQTVLLSNNTESLIISSYFCTTTEHSHSCGNKIVTPPWSISLLVN